eukprot:NODE_2238_length_961_cov_34.270833_g1844_i0.p2 GENE.NODE_2238_length_961_cov_34.270833_g1844_i0~~NODE_2238_length_961_cov_34.270833_g1844_i0.p2  ORF type:complete len:152 (-),score=21.32 NODE_2238_length_961_cov_34.270833_g1844_i0:70-525(-)
MEWKNRVLLFRWAYVKCWFIPALERVLMQAANSSGHITFQNFRRLVLPGNATRDINPAFYKVFGPILLERNYFNSSIDRWMARHGMPFPPPADRYASFKMRARQAAQTPRFMCGILRRRMGCCVNPNVFNVHDPAWAPTNVDCPTPSNSVS